MIRGDSIYKLNYLDHLVMKIPFQESMVMPQITIKRGIHGIRIQKILIKEVMLKSPMR